jgi:hypothetical protein
MKPQQPAAYYDPNDPQRTVHVWNSVRKLPKELQQLQQQQQQHQQKQEPMQQDDMEPDVEGNAMLEGVILPAFDNVSPSDRSVMYLPKYDPMLIHRSDREYLTRSLGEFWSDVETLSLRPNGLFQVYLLHSFLKL